MKRQASGDTSTLLERVTKDVEETERKEEMNKAMKGPAAFKGLKDDLDEIDENDVGMDNNYIQYLNINSRHLYVWIKSQYSILFCWILI